MSFTRAISLTRPFASRFSSFRFSLLILGMSPDQFYPNSPYIAFMTLIAVILAVLLLNIPFGYWRSATRKYSIQWILAIHLPVPGVVALRVFSGLGWQLYTFPLLITAFFTGQYLGGRLHAWMNTHGRMTATGCLVMDMYRTLQK